MKIDNFDFQSLVLVKWSPLLLPISVGGLALSTLWKPLSMSALLLMSIIALSYSLTVVLSKAKESALLTALEALVFYGGGELIRAWVFPGESGWVRPLQLASLIFVVLIIVLSICGLMQKGRVEG